MLNMLRVIIASVLFLAVCITSLKTDGVVPNTFVIEFDRPIHSFASKRHVLSKRSNFYQQLDVYNISYQVRHEYEVINAVSIAFKSLQDASLFFEKSLGVKKAWPVNNVLKPTAYHTKRQVGNELVSSLFDLYNATGVNRVRNELGLTGKDIKVGILDTGIDYMHPALGGCFGEKCRVAYGYDFVGDAYNGSNTPIPDDDPRDTCQGHGTHVAGIIGARDTKFNFTGIAPDVTFGAYRILGCNGTVSDDLIMKAMERAYLDGMDVINLSLGVVGWPDSPVSLMGDEFALKGMIVCAAAGNAGEEGIFEVNSPSLGKHVLSVASVDNTRMITHGFKLQNNQTVSYLAENGPFHISTAQLVAASDQFLTPNDGCNPLKINATGKVVLIGLGGCLFSQKVLNAQEAGAIGVIIYNDVRECLVPSVDDSKVNINYGGITKEDGYELFHYLKKNPGGDGVSVEFLKRNVLYSLPNAGLSSSFSSWGLGPDLSLKPDISAPGGHIFSTYPINMDSYASLSGTSMASPYVAGVVALLQQSRGGNRAIGVKEVRTILMNNGHPFKLAGADSLQSVAKQGSGLIDVYHAMQSDTSVSPEQIRLNDTVHGDKNYEYTLTIKNNGRLASEYLIGHRAASAAQGFEKNETDNTSVQLKTPIPLVDHELDAVVDVYNSLVMVEANQELNITVRIAPPVNSALMPPSIYSGYITISKSNEREDVKYVPYAGLTAPFFQLPVILINSTTPLLVSQRINNASSPAALVSFQLLESSPLLLVSVVNATNINQNYGLIPGGSVANVLRKMEHASKNVSVVYWYGNVALTTEEASSNGFCYFQPADTQPQFSSDLSVIGKKLDKGIYKLKIMALKLLGNVNNKQDFDTWLSPDIVLE